MVSKWRKKEFKSWKHEENSTLLKYMLIHKFNESALEKSCTRWGVHRTRETMYKVGRTQELSGGALTFSSKGTLSTRWGLKTPWNYRFHWSRGQGLSLHSPPPSQSLPMQVLYPLEYHAVHFISKQISMFWIEEK